MRATLWIAASGFLLASGSAYAAGLANGNDDAGYLDGMAAASSPRRVDDTVTDQGPQPGDLASSAKARKGARRAAEYDLSTMQPAEAGPQENAGARSSAVTVDPQHPGGEFPSGG